jgi:hypothetical protein
MQSQNPCQPKQNNVKEINSTFQDGVVFLTCDLIATNNKMLCNEVLWHLFEYCLKWGKDTKFQQQGLPYTSYVQ